MNPTRPFSRPAVLLPPGVLAASVLLAGCSSPGAAPNSTPRPSTSATPSAGTDKPAATSTNPGSGATTPQGGDPAPSGVGNPAQAGAAAGALAGSGKALWREDGLPAANSNANPDSSVGPGRYVLVVACAGKGVLRVTARSGKPGGETAAAKPVARARVGCSAAPKPVKLKLTNPARGLSASEAPVPGTSGVFSWQLVRPSAR